MLWVGYRFHKILLVVQDVVCVSVFELVRLDDGVVLGDPGVQHVVVGAQVSVDETVGHAVQVEPDAHRPFEPEVPAQRQTRVLGLDVPQEGQVFPKAVHVQHDSCFRYTQYGL